MKLQNFETGLQRVYYLIWAMIASLSISMMICGDPSGWFVEGDCDRHSLKTFELIWAAIAVVFPGIVMFAVRWIYRGFIPK